MSYITQPDVGPSFACPHVEFNLTDSLPLRVILGSNHLKVKEGK